MMDIHFRCHAGPDSVQAAELFAPPLAVLATFQEFGGVALAIGPLISACGQGSAIFKMLDWVTRAKEDLL
jgi:hypothetical protein